MEGTFAKRLRELRLENNCTLKELSKRVYIDKSSLSRMERKEKSPKAEELIALAKFFNVTTDYLCGLED